ncbi:MAG: aminotransferase class V-fold PLP-dependent enzyme [Gemmatimonadales bacterium]
MTQRRSFLKQMSTIAGATAFAGLIDARRAFARQLEALPSSFGQASGFALLRDRYMLDPDVIYFNHGSIGTVPRAVHEAHVQYLSVCETNPWLYMWGGEWEEPRERVRENAAALMGCDSAELSLTHNTTEGFSTLANGMSLGPGDEVLFSSLNHDGASVCWQHNASLKGFTVRRFDFPVLDVPTMPVEEILDLYDRNISTSTRVLVLPHIDNVVGLLHPVREITELAKSKGVEVVAVDGAQAVGMLDVNMRDLDVDVYCTSPHKWLQSPKGLGLMYVRREIQGSVRPMWVTWGQQRWSGTARIFEDYGTRNLPGLLALGDAIDFQRRLGSEAKERRYREIWQQFRTATERSDRVSWRSPENWELSASLFALEVTGVPSTDFSEFMYRDHGFVFRPFSTHGLNTVRISPNVYNTQDEIERFFEVVDGM